MAIRSTKRTSVAWAVVLLAVPLLAWAEAKADGPATAMFEGVGPAGFKVEGTTDQVGLKDDGKTVTVVVPLGTLKTGISLRDRHLREKYVETAKYPNAELAVPWSELKLPAEGQSSTGKGNGKMTIHGVTRDVPFSYSIQHSGTHYQVTGDVPLKLTDFEIKIPSYLGVTVKPDIKTHVTFGAVRP